MIIKKNFLIILLVCLGLLTGCHANVNIEEESDYTKNEQIKQDYDNEDEKIANEEMGSISKDNINEKQNNTEGENGNIVSKNRETEMEIYGKWYLEKVVLKSEAYDGTDLDALGGYDVEDYVGYELEVTDKYLRLGQDKFLNPEYSLEYMTVPEYNDGGKFKQPSFYGFIENENIDIVNSEKYESVSELPLKFYQVKFEEDYFIPVGTELIVLNNDTLLVGAWGKIILARRIEN